MVRDEVDSLYRNLEHVRTSESNIINSIDAEIEELERRKEERIGRLRKQSEGTNKVLLEYAEGSASGYVGRIVRREWQNHTDLLRISSVDKVEVMPKFQALYRNSMLNTITGNMYECFNVYVLHLRVTHVSSGHGEQIIHVAMDYSGKLLGTVVVASCLDLLQGYGGRDEGFVHFDPLCPVYQTFDRLIDSDFGDDSALAEVCKPLAPSAKALADAVHFVSSIEKEDLPIHLTEPEGLQYEITKFYNKVVIGLVKHRLEKCV